MRSRDVLRRCIKDETLFVNCSVQVAWIIIRSDPIRILIIRIWRSFYIHADMDNPNPVYMRMRSRIWYHQIPTDMEYPIFERGLSDVYNRIISD